MGLSALQWLAKHLGVEWPRGENFFGRVRAVVAKALPECSEAEVLDILAVQLTQREEMEWLLQVDDVGSLVHRGDVRDFENHVSASRKANGEAVEFRKSWQAAKAQLRAQGPPGARPVRNAAGERYQTPYPAGDLDREVALSLCPPGWRIYSDPVNSRWQCSRPGKAISRSWHLHGHAESCRLALAAAWSDWLLREGLVDGDCPIEGLMAGGLADAADDRGDV